MTVLALSLWLLFGLLAAVHLLRAWDLSASELGALAVGLGLTGLLASALVRALPPRLALLAWGIVLISVPVVLYDFYRALAVAVRPVRTKGGLSSRLRNWLPVLALLVVAAFFRFSHLGYSEFQGDEARAMLLAQALVERRDASLLLWHKKGPAEVLVPAAALSLGDKGEGAARLPFAVAGLGAVLALYSLGRRLVTARAAWLAGLVLAIDGYMIAFSRIVQYQSIVVLSTVLAMWCAWRFSRGGPLAGRYLLLAGLLLGLGTWAHYEMLLVWPAAFWLALSRGTAEGWKVGQRLCRVAPAVSLAALVTAVFYVPFVRHPQFAATGSYIDRRLGNELFYNQLLDYFHRASFYNASFYVLLVMGTLLATFGFGLAWLLTGVLARSGAGQRRWPGLVIGWSLAMAWMGAASLALARPAWFEHEGRSLAIVVCLPPLALLLLTGRLPVSWRAIALWFTIPFCVMAFLTAKPHTHFYTMMPAAALLCGWAWDRAMAWLEDERRLGPSHARIGVLTLGLSLFGLFAAHQYVVFVRHQPEYKRVYPEARLPIWTPFGGQPPRGGYFGFPYRAGWNALRRLGQPLMSDYDSNEERLITGWYTWGAIRCADRPARYYVAWRPQDPETLPLEMIWSEYRRVVVACVQGAAKLTVWQRPDAGLAVRSDANLPEIWLDGPGVPGGVRWCGRLPAAACPTPEAARSSPASPASADLAGCLAAGSDAGSSLRGPFSTADADAWRASPLAVSQALGLPLPQVAYDLRWAEGVQLLGADFPGVRSIERQGSRPRLHLRPGEGLGVLLVWRAEARPTRNYSVFVHLRRMNGELVAQHDSWPECGRWPMSTWQPGQLVFDGHFLQARDSTSAESGLAAGDYQLLAGIYDAANGERLALEEVESAEPGVIELARVTVSGS